ncbi:MAG: choice-of-anchor tandem repeat GloVer-containing protein [Chthoniobacterales bacterium]
MPEDVPPLKDFLIFALLCACPPLEGTLRAAVVGKFALCYGMRYLLRNSGALFMRNIHFLIPLLFSASLASAQLESVYSFQGTDGAWSRGSLTLVDNVLYGRTSLGGTDNSGTIFSLNAGTVNGSFNWLYSFTASPTDGLGNEPHHNALVAVGDTLYGAALYGGNENNPQPPEATGTTPPPVFSKDGNGTIFSIKTDGTGYTAVHAFDGTGTTPPPVDAALPHSPFYLKNGIAYGMTSNGGANNNQGAIYSFSLADPAGTYKVDYSFALATGITPHGVLTSDSTGTLLLGMTRAGGGTPGEGVIFSFDPTDLSYNVLHTFENIPTNGADNAHGFLTLIGTTVYGTTAKGGANGEKGTIFSMNEDGTNFQIIHSFGGLFGSTTDGIAPFGSLVLVDGLLYGTTTDGGANGYGTLFSLNPTSDDYALLDSFDLATTGGRPEDNIVAWTNGGITTLYGLTQNGGMFDPTGDNYFGTIFAYTIPEPSTWALLGVALLVIVGRQYRRRIVAATIVK